MGNCLSLRSVWRAITRTRIEGLCFASLTCRIPDSLPLNLPQVKSLSSSVFRLCHHPPWHHYWSRLLEPANHVSISTPNSLDYVGRQPLLWFSAVKAHCPKRSSCEVQPIYLVSRNVLFLSPFHNKHSFCFFQQS